MRFRQGELGIVIKARGPASRAALGMAVVIHKVGPWAKGEEIRYMERTWVMEDRADYLVEVDGLMAFFIVEDYQLKKIDGAPDPRALSEELEVSA